MHQLVLRKQQKFNYVTALSSLSSTMKPLNHHESPSIHFGFHIARASLWKIFFTHEVWPLIFCFHLFFYKMVNSQQINNNLYNLTLKRKNKQTNNAI